MKLFGGDPRSIYLKILIDLNKWYVLLLFIIFICLCPVRAYDNTFLLTFILFILVEFIRLILTFSYTKGNVPVFVAFIILSIIPMLVLDFLWIFFVDSRTNLDLIMMIGMAIIHIVEIALSIYCIIKLSRYQGRFYKFQYGYRALEPNAPQENELEDF